MKVSMAIPGNGSSAVGMNATWRLEDPNPGEGRRYRQSFTVHLATAGMAEGLELDDATGFRLRALSLSFDALDGDAPEAAQVAELKNDLLVTLPLPRLVSSVRFRSQKVPGGKTTALHRTDGEAIAEEPVATYVNPSTFVARTKTTGGKTGASQQIAMSAGNDAQIVDVGSKLGVQAPVGIQSQHELGVIDGRIVVRLMGSGGAVELESGDITQFNLTTQPENLRVGVALPELGDEVFFVPIGFEPGATVDVGEALRGQLADLVRNLLDALASEAPADTHALLPDPLAVRLVFESDAPCRFQISQFQVSYRLLRESFPDGASKQVLRFTDNPISEQIVELDLPGATVFLSAHLTVSGGGGDSGTASSAAAIGDTPVPPLISPGEHGVRVEAGSPAWASPISIVSPQLVSAFDLHVATLGEETDLTLEVYGDVELQPEGDVVARVELSVAGASPAQRLRFAFPSPGVLLQPRRYWLVISASAGIAVWYLTPAVGERLLRDHDGQWRGASALNDRRAIAAVVGGATAPSSTGSGPAVALNGISVTPLTGDGDRVYDLIPALAPAGGGGLTRTQLQIVSASPRPVTVYPPRLVFEV